MLQTKAAIASAKRFWPKVSVTKNPYKCWEWKASKNKAGYGQISTGGRKGRVARGKKLPQTKLTVRQVTEIRRAYTRMIRKVSKRYKISQSMVTSIIHKTRRVK